MARELIRYEPPVSDHLHPFVYKAVVGLALCLVLAAWLLFGIAGGDIDLSLTLVSTLILMAVAIPFALWLVWRRDQESDAANRKSDSFRDWAACDFATWQCRLKGTDAAIEILLPIAALALGMTAIGIVLQLTAHGIL